MRYRSDGRLDRTFGEGGHVTTDFGNGGFGEAASAVLVQPDDGKIVAAGGAFIALPEDDAFAIARYGKGGALDQSFSTDGIETESFASDSVEYIAALAIQGNGKIFAAGGSPGAGGGDFAVLRFEADGGLDTGFSSGAPAGVALTDFESRRNGAFGIVIQPDQPSARVVLAGHTDDTDFSSGFDFALARYHAGG